MKKWTIVLVVAMLLTGWACAEEIDWSAMTLEELQTAGQNLAQEINVRFGGSLGYVGAGTFVVGKNIRPGDYNLLVHKVLNNDGYAMIRFYASEADFNNNDYFDYAYMYPGSIVTLTLREGMVIRLGSVQAEVQTCTASWLIGQ